MTSNELAERIQRRLDKVGMSARAASLTAGLSDAFVRNILKGKSQSPRAENFEALARVLGTTSSWLLSGEGPEDLDGPHGETGSPDHPESVAPSEAKSAPRGSRPAPNVDFSKAEDAPPLHRFGGPRNVPVFGTAVGGGDDDGDFRFNGETIDYAPRPPGIAHKKDVYVLYVENDSMFPKFEPGERLYVDPHRKPRVGDYAVVELFGTEEGEAGKGFIKRLVKQTTTKVVVSQFNPPKELEFDRDKVKSLHRVIPTDELLGV